MGRLTDKVAVVTGSSSGNGRAIALALAANARRSSARTSAGRPA
jgi:NAD(P)-dependent dehydrogenase (short-subunit alcohol dehydrogenase family)